MRFKPGDTVIHQRYGPGEIVGFHDMDNDGETRRYLSIQLTDDKGTLYIPEDAVDEGDLRVAVTDINRIREILEQTPSPLSSDSSQRQRTIRRQLNSGEPLKIAEALRDLAWREKDKNLTDSEIRLKGEAMRRLIDEMALGDHENLATVRNELVTALDNAIAQHDDTEEEDQAV